MQVHDELVLEVPQGELDPVKVELPRLMAGVLDLAVPLSAEVGAGVKWEQAYSSLERGMGGCSEDRRRDSAQNLRVTPMRDSDA
jgi:hypothetical protein